MSPYITLLLHIRSRKIIFRRLSNILCLCHSLYDVPFGETVCDGRTDRYLACVNIYMACIVLGGYLGVTSVKVLRLTQVTYVNFRI